MHNVSEYSTGSSLGTETIDPGRIPRILDHPVERLEAIKFDIDTCGKRLTEAFNFSTMADLLLVTN